MESFKEYFEEAMLFEMANFRPKSTGLKTTIFISSGYVAGKKLNHGPRIKVSRTYSEKMNPLDTFSVTISDNPEVIGANNLKSEDIEQIKEFIILNKEVLLAYWEGEYDTSDLYGNLEKVK